MKRKTVWIPVTIRIPKPIHVRLQLLLKAKPHYTQQAIIIDLLERGLPDYTRAGGPSA